MPLVSILCQQFLLREVNVRILHLFSAGNDMN